MAMPNAKVETAKVVESKPANVKLVKKDVSPFDEGGCFISPLVQFDFFRERKFADILKLQCYYLSAAFSQEPLIFTDKERAYLSERLEFYFNHARSLMLSSVEQLSPAKLLEEFIKAGDKEKAFQLMEELKGAHDNKEKPVEIEIQPISFQEAKDMVLSNFIDHCQVFMLSLKEISTRY